MRESYIVFKDNNQLGGVHDIRGAARRPREGFALEERREIGMSNSQIVLFEIS